jgi:maltose-binding protein MalE
MVGATRRRPPRRGLVVVAGFAVAVVALAACSSSKKSASASASPSAAATSSAAAPTSSAPSSAASSPTAATSSAVTSAAPGSAPAVPKLTIVPGAKITVWVDAPRVPAVQAFEKAYPNVPVEMNTINGNVGADELEQKFVLFNQANSGWPDAIFFPSNDDIAWATSSKINYAADVKSSLSSVLSGYSAAAIAPCVFGAEVRCVRNDAAADVLWYNKTLFTQWGYTPPTTWEDYQALSVKIAQQHPGYITGFLGDAYAPDRYLWASGCPTQDQTGPTAVHINTADPNCSRALNLVDTLIGAKALSPVGIFDPSAATVGQKMVMSPGAVWWGDYLFRDTWKIPAGQMTAAAPLKWSSDTQNYTGDEGGGLWGVSSHAKGDELTNTLAFATFVVSDPRWQVDLTTGLPAYGPLQQAWINKALSDNYFADSTTTAAAFKAAVGEVRPNHDYMLYDTGGIWTQTVTPVLTAGKTLTAAWPAFTSQLLNQAKTFGYKVSSTGS